MEILSVKNLSAGYEKNRVLQGINFSVGEGEVLAVIGQNGCGKSTLLKTIARLISDNTGDIIFEGMNINKLRPWELRPIGISWFVQGGMVFPTMKVKDHLVLSLKENKKLTNDQVMEECFSYFPSLRNCLEIRGGNLSGGQRQMLSFAMLLSQQTKFWILDEPTAGLSPELVKNAISFLQKMKLESNKAMILVEHNYPIAFELADQVAIIKEGKISGSFSKQEYKDKSFLTQYLYN